jgi:hypothetical protein
MPLLITKGFLSQLWTLVPSYDTQDIQGPIHELLGEYNLIFEEVKRLPPPRTHDHQIVLKGTKSNTGRPYHYPFYQKTEIKKKNSARAAGMKGSST